MSRVWPHRLIDGVYCTAEPSVPMHTRYFVHEFACVARSNPSSLHRWSMSYATNNNNNKARYRKANELQGGRVTRIISKGDGKKKHSQH